MAGTRSGFNAKTRQELARSGNLRKDRHGELKSPEPTTGRPDPPSELAKVAQEEWDRMVWAFEDMGMLHKVDRFALYQYCQLYAETEAVSLQQDEAKAGLEILEENLTGGRSGPDEERLTVSDRVQLFAQIVTMHKLISKCTDQLRSGRMAIRQYLVEFGLTPASRGRIKLPSKGEAVVDAFEQHRKLRQVK